MQAGRVFHRIPRAEVIAEPRGLRLAKPAAIFAASPFLNCPPRPMIVVLRPNSTREQIEEVPLQVEGGRVGGKRFEKILGGAPDSHRDRDC